MVPVLVFFLRNWLIGYIQKFCRTSLKALEIEVIEVEPIPQQYSQVKTDSEGQSVQTGVLWASNHVSWLDIFVLNAVRATTFIAKHEIRSWPLIGWLVAHDWSSLLVSVVFR